ncbi:DUF4440 domain-containing protein [Clostridium sp. chh4-2]|uniref:LytTR family transcriptional regulator DNA-binding domain-containing protein n=1 Tax=Clostridium sp. chh4-2 TaxID=2067550 RepID=UPI000CCDC14E|nr:LytTR family transcriptional regulator DNA-binding domain-containing protein [Clostridium sp. chh4-2]PNV59113.1 DUF4440 domain-containing protein [Clostridium sp. chh4-2]
MKYRHYTNQEVLKKTREAIHMFIRKQIRPFTELLDDNFVWIGDFEPLYMQGIQAFLESVKEEIQELPVNITEEEYALLSHEHHMWVTYGRFTADASGLTSRIHFTFVWKQTGDNLRLLHANANHARKMPPDTAQSKIFEQPLLENQLPYPEGARKLALRDLSGCIHYLLTDDVLFIKADNKICGITTKNGVFSCRMPLRELARPPFVQIHKSYLVNPAYIRRICRYQASLPNGILLPIGKYWYMDLKQRLTESDKAQYPQ